MICDDIADAERRILALVPELMMALRIESAARRLAFTAETVSSPMEAESRIRDLRPALIVLDLDLKGVDVVSVASQARAAGVPVLAFYPHVDVEKREAARAAGVKHVYARSRFLRELPRLLAQFVKA